MKEQNNPALPGFEYLEPDSPKNETSVKPLKPKSPKNQKVTISICCTAEWRKRVKIAAITSGKTLSDFVIEAIKSKMKS